MKIRKRLYNNEATHLKLEIKNHDKERKQARYQITKEQWNEILDLRDERRFVTVQQKFNKDGEITSSVDKLQDSPIEIPNNHEIVRISTNNTTGQQWVITKPKREIDIEKEIDFDFITDVVKKHINPIEHTDIFIGNRKTFDRLIYTDAHIGMTPNQDGYSLYGGKWDEEVLNIRLQEIITSLNLNQSGDTLVIDDLGDFVDGWDGETVRKGHKLPQNMDNQKMFDVGLAFKVNMVDLLVKKYNKIIVNNICEDNHAGSFGYVINSAFKSIVEQKYSNIEVTNHRKFINHYFIGSHCFVISHGKDSKSLKFGFKPHLDPRQAEKIDQYLKQNKIYRDCEFVEFSKGDSHQLLFDYATSDDFDYMNYHAFSPSSEWVQTNFKKGRSGFTVQNVSYEENVKKIHPYFFK